MNILFLCNEYPPCILVGGIGVFTKAIAEGMQNRGHSVVVAGLYRDLSSKMVQTIENGVSVYKLKYVSGLFKSIRSRYLLYALVKRIIHRYSIDLIEAPDYEGLLGFWPRLPVPVIIRLHGSVTYFLKEMNQPLDKRLYSYEKSTINKATLVISVSNYTAAITKNLFSINSPIEIVHNFIDHDAETPDFQRHETPLKIVFTGTLMKKKGVYSLIDAWPNVLKIFPKAHLHLFGKDSVDLNSVSVKQSLVQMVPKDLSGSVHFHGYVDRIEIQKELRSASVAVFPSFSETFGLAPLEAMIQGCPTIFTKLASGPEIIDSGKNGILIDPSRPDEISNAIISLLSDTSLSRKLGSEGRKSALQRFSKNQQLDKNEALYRQVVSMRKTAF
jgi:glycogen synthase